jgi:hypothetical protein
MQLIKIQLRLKLTGVKFAMNEGLRTFFIGTFSQPRHT